MNRIVPLVLGLVLLAAPAGAQQSHPLLRDAFVNPASTNAKRVKPKRSRFVQVDLAPLKLQKMNRGQRKKVEQLLSVALFDDVRLQVVLDTAERTGIGSFAWTGRIEGDPRSAVVVAVQDEAMTATFTTADASYEVRPTAGGVHEALEIDRTAFPDEQDPLPPLLPAEGSVTAAAAAEADGETTVDVLVAYTHIVRQQAGSTAAAQTLATNAVAATNAAYARSGVTMRLRLVGTTEVQYDDTIIDFSSTLSRVTGTSDGFMDTIHAIRNSVGADEVSLLVGGPIDDGCGVGWIMTGPSADFAPYAFHVVRDDCAISNHSFAHEMGHNFGLAHDRANASGAGAWPYAYGYQHPQRLFRTIMAYNCPAGGCPRVGYFANPDILYNNVPTGISYLAANSADTARALNASAPTIAAWRAEVAPPPAAFTDNPLIAGTTVVKAAHITELRTAINTLRTQKGLAAATWTTPPVPGTPIDATHILELRNALTPALAVAPAYTDATLTTVKAVHIQELRNLLD